MQYCVKNFTYNKKHGQRNLYFLFIKYMELSF